MTSYTCEIAMRLLEASPAMSFDKATQTAEECQQLAIAADVDPNECKTADLFLPGSDVPDPAAHAYQAMTRGDPELHANQTGSRVLDGNEHPEYFQLHYYSASARQTRPATGRVDQACRELGTVPLGRLALTGPAAQALPATGSTATSTPFIPRRNQDRRPPLSS